jgi:hypothetical protein
VWFKVPNRTRVVGQDSEFANKLEVWKQRAAAAAVAPDPDTPPPKVFQPKHQLPPVQDYKSAQTAEFWSQFPHNYALAGKSTICPAKLRALAWSVGYRDLELLELVCRDLTDGADIGCRGQARNASVSTNAPSAFDFPEQITDAIADWIVAGFAAGPFSPDDRPANAKVNGIMCRQKPNGSARIILNLSAPKGDCVNDGIRSEEFPTTMSSTRKWLEVLDRAGQRCLIVKLDWPSAYKHLDIRPEDVILQYFSWLGMDFTELCLVFGCRSSAGLYDRLAKLVLHIVILFAKFPAHMVCQYLDDVCAAAPEGSSSLHRFEKAYRDIAAHLGVQLAPTSDPDKAFRPTTNGVVLGVHYDTVSWTWHIPEEKLARLLQQIREIDGKTWVRQHELWSVVGRILHYAPLIPGGKFNISELISAHGSNQDRMEWVEVTAPVRRQLYFWWLMLKTTHRHTSIPLPERFPAWTFEFFTDASGVHDLIRTRRRRHWRAIVVHGALGLPHQQRHARLRWQAFEQEAVRPGTARTAHLHHRWPQVLQALAGQSVGGQLWIHRGLEKRIQHSVPALHHNSHGHRSHSRRNRLHLHSRQDHQVLYHRSNSCR